MKRENVILSTVFVLSLLVIFLLEGVHGLLTVLYAIVLFVSFALLSYVVAIVVHELGHLVMGLLTGYKFVSFRLFSLHLQRDNKGALKFYKKSLPGTHGQCLMLPPEKKTTPIFWYNFGGVFFNFIFSLVFLLLFLRVDVFSTSAMLYGTIAFVNGFVGLLNWIPYKDIKNDGANYRIMKDSPLAREAMYHSLLVNHQVSNGARSDELDVQSIIDLNLDYSDHIQFGLSSYVINKYMDEGDYVKAIKLHNKVYELMKDSNSIQSHIVQFDRYMFKLVFQAEDAAKYNTEKVQLIRKKMSSNSAVKIIDVLEDYYNNDEVLNEQLYEEFVLLCEKSSTQGITASKKEFLDSIVFEKKEFKLYEEIDW